MILGGAQPIIFKEVLRGWGLMPQYEKLVELSKAQGIAVEPSKPVEDDVVGRRRQPAAHAGAAQHKLVQAPKNFFLGRHDSREPGHFCRQNHPNNALHRRNLSTWLLPKAGSRHAGITVKVLGAGGLEPPTR